MEILCKFTCLFLYSITSGMKDHIVIHQIQHSDCCSYIGVLLKEFYPFYFFHNGFYHVTANYLCLPPLQWNLLSKNLFLLTPELSFSVVSSSIQSSTNSSVSAPLIPSEYSLLYYLHIRPFKVMFSNTFQPVSSRLSLRSDMLYLPALLMRLMPWKALKCVFQNSLRVKDISLMTLKHLVKRTFVYSFLKLQITCWPAG